MNNHLKIILIDFFVSFLIILYGTFRCKTSSFRDPFTYSLTGNFMRNFLDGWGIMHFLYFMLLGYWFPQNLPTIFIMGVIWELVESYSSEHPFYLSTCNYIIQTDNSSGWWYGRWEDIVMNTLGMFCGFYLATSYQSKRFKKIRLRK